MRLKLKTIGIIIKYKHVEAGALALQIAQRMYHKGIKVLFEMASAQIVKDFVQFNLRDKKVLQKIKILSKEKMVEASDLIIVCGGDGTYLSIARLMRKRSIPILGINMGQLGFLTEIKQSESLDTLDQILSGQSVHLSERALIDVSVFRKNRLIFNEPAVNDAVITQGAIARIITLNILINHQLINTIRADGLIISTPTGSTAYSLAAGGPIVEPTLKATLLTPLCPHSLTQRPLVISDRSEIQIQLQGNPGLVMLTLDGQTPFHMKKGDQVVIQKFKKHALKMVSSSTRDYFSLLHEKLMFGMR